MSGVVLARRPEDRDPEPGRELAEREVGGGTAEADAWTSDAGGRPRESPVRPRAPSVASTGWDTSREGLNVGRSLARCAGRPHRRAGGSA